MSSNDLKQKLANIFDEKTIKPNNRNEYLLQ